MSRHLPNEILLLLFRQLHKQDLKSVRIVCKLWSSLAAELLFDRIFISPHEKNVEVFHNIASRPDLGKSIRELIYDISIFAELNRLEYFDALCQQIRFRTLCLPRKYRFQTADAQVNEVLQYARDDHGITLLSEGRGPHLMKYRIVDRGYRAYLEYASQQKEFCESGELLALLCLDLKLLPRVEAVTVGDDWRHYTTDRQFNPSTLCPLHRVGCPLARSWNPLFLEPKTMGRTDDGHVEFFIIMRALALSQTRVHSFLSRPYLRLYQTAFDTKALMSSSLLQYVKFALRDVQKLSMRICSRQGYDTGSVDGLQAMLHSLTALQHLDLDLSKLVDDEYTLYTLSEIIGFHCHWTFLSFLKLSSFASDESFLIRFLCVLPALRGLDFTNVELTSGSWTSAVDHMRKSLRLQTFSLTPPLRHLGGIALWEELAWKEARMDEKVEHYILCGGKNPLRIEDHEW